MLLTRGYSFLLLGVPSANPVHLLLRPDRVRICFQAWGTASRKCQRGESLGQPEYKRCFHLEFLGDDKLVLGKSIHAAIAQIAKL